MLPLSGLIAHTTRLPAIATFEIWPPGAVCSVEIVSGDAKNNAHGA